MITITNPELTNDGCYALINGDLHEVYQDENGEMYIIDFENGNTQIYLEI